MIDFNVKKPSKKNQMHNPLVDKIARSTNQLVVAMSDLLRDPSMLTGYVSQQLFTAVKLLEQKLVAEGPVSAADHVSGWLRLVAQQHPELFVEFPFAERATIPFLDKWSEILSNHLDVAETSVVDTLIKRLHEKLSQQSSAIVRALFVGDCLIWDIATQLQILAHSQNFDVNPTLISKRIGADLRRSVKSFSPDQFDLIFYSPFSFGFSEEYAQFSAPKKMLKAIATQRAALKQTADDSLKTIELLQQYFESPLYVHTVSGIRQNMPGWRGSLGNFVTYPTRRWASAHLNMRLSNYMEKFATNGKRSLRWIDEGAPLARMSDRALGQVMYNVGELHPTALAQELAHGPYSRACKVVAHLKKRKLIVCDLDNTLWDGIIGDGPVRQHTDRQHALLQLKNKGVLLAVSSKNDPANVRWDESVVSASDFVGLEINWGRKASNIRKIADTLNLNPNSFVFLDDRPDERATVTEELPGILALDPNEAETWQLIEEWTQMLSGSALNDRTAMYQERMARQSYLEHHEANLDEVNDAYRKLNLSLTLRHPNDEDMDRVVELINRTNQFNTTAARITMSEINRTEFRRHIVVAEARDKFGDMGIIGILVVTLNGQPRITHFVLSCRVFGFSIENAMVQSILRSFPDQTITAELVKTPVNGPCQQVYACNGFNKEGTVWFSKESRPGIVPDWLAVEDRCAVVAAPPDAR